MPAPCVDDFAFFSALDPIVYSHTLGSKGLVSLIFYFRTILGEGHLQQGGRCMGRLQPHYTLFYEPTALVYPSARFAEESV
jgi:hypothetical protein